MMSMGTTFHSYMYAVCEKQDSSLTTL